MSSKDGNRAEPLDEQHNQAESNPKEQPRTVPRERSSNTSAYIPHPSIPRGQQSVSIGSSSSSYRENIPLEPLSRNAAPQTPPRVSDTPPSHVASKQSKKRRLQKARQRLDPLLEASSSSRQLESSAQFIQPQPSDTNLGHASEPDHGGPSTAAGLTIIPEVSTSRRHVGSSGAFIQPHPRETNLEHVSESDHGGPSAISGPLVTPVLPEAVVVEDQEVAPDLEAALGPEVVSVNVEDAPTSESEGEPPHEVPESRRDFLPNFYVRFHKRFVTAFRPKKQEEHKITKHIHKHRFRVTYLLALCQALLKHGAPTHRIVEYMKCSASALDVKAQFLYLPGCMIISFENSTTPAVEIRLACETVEVNLDKLGDVHELYKLVIHDEVGARKAIKTLQSIDKRLSKFRPAVLVLCHGFAALTVAPYAYHGRWIDLPACFLVGSLLGYLRIIIAPRTPLHSNIFEVASSLFITFVARALGSISSLCFSAIAQSSIIMILPGYTVLCAASELQAGSMVAGSVRIVYAIVSSLFIGFGVTTGATLFGSINKHATSETQCASEGSSGETWLKLFSVPFFALFLAILHHAKCRQMPVMIVIAVAGSLVSYYAQGWFKQHEELPSALAATLVAFLANIYARIGSRLDARFCEGVPQDSWKRTLLNRKFWGHTSAASAMLPAVLVLVPSGIAITGSLVAGVATADQIRDGLAARATGSTPETIMPDSDKVLFVVAGKIIQVAIGITVGLFWGTFLAYPFGKGGESRQIMGTGISSL